MAFYITFFCKSVKTSALEAFEALIHEIGTREEALEIRTRKDGEGWVTCELASARTGYVRAGDAIVLELHTDSATVMSEVRDYGDEVNAPRIADADLVITLTLVGDVVDWQLVRNIWLSVAALWPMVPYSDVSGFDIDLDSLA